MSTSQTTEGQSSTSSPAGTCSECNAPMQPDQQYCLNCGASRGSVGHGVPPIGPVGIPSPADDQPFLRRTMSVGAAALCAALILAGVGVGVLIGSSGSDDNSSKQVANVKPQIITVKIPQQTAAAPATTAPTTTEVPFTSDWKATGTAYTIQLQTLPNTDPTTSVDAAKTEASSQGANDVGALNSDDFPSLEPGSYVIYSGTFKKKKKATKALKKLRKSFPSAKVIKVTSDSGNPTFGGKDAEDAKKQLEQLQHIKPEDYSKKSKALPNQTEVPGTAPPKDDKAPGGGGDIETIG